MANPQNSFPKSKNADAKRVTPSATETDAAPTVSEFCQRGTSAGRH